MQFYHLPSGANGLQSEIAFAHQHGVIKQNIGAFIDGKSWQAEGGQTQPPIDGPFKPWRDSSFLWTPEASRIYIFLGRNPDGTYAHVPVGPVAGSISSNPDNVAATNGLTVEQQRHLKIFSRGWWNFISQYGGDFGGIMPLCVVAGITAQEALRFSPGGDIAEVPKDYPLGWVIDQMGSWTNFPSDVGLRFNPSTGEPEWFFFQDYVRENPKPKSGNVTGILSDAELAGAAAAIVADSTMTVAAKGAAIRRAAK